MPPISFHSEEATADQANDKGRISVDVKGLVRPRLDHFNGSAEFSDVIGQVGAYEVKDCREAAQREPGGSHSTVGVAVVKGGAIRPDVLPLSRHAAQAGDGNRGGGSIFPEEPGVSSMISETVRPSEEGLRGIK